MDPETCDHEWETVLQGQPWEERVCLACGAVQARVWDTEAGGWGEWEGAE